MRTGFVHRVLGLVPGLLLAACSGGGGGGSSGGGGGGGVMTPNPILFVTQVPVINDFLTIGSTFGNHDGSTHAAARGGDLWIRYQDGTLRNLTAEAGYGDPAGFQGASSIAVREPCVHWSGTKAVFSMVVGAPTAPGSGTFRWQLYEITGLGQGETAVITTVAKQPTGRNNVSPCYASDDRILFLSDRPRNGAAHLAPQLDEYEEAPTNTGIWKLDPVSGQLFLMNHSPSGSFGPFVDSFGRVVFTRWDHLERDQQGDLEAMGQGIYGLFDYADESAGAATTMPPPDEIFPEPRKQWIDYVNAFPGGYTGPLRGWEPQLVGSQQNHFLPWTLNQDGTVEETLNHVGRHELFSFIDKNRNDDPEIVDHVGFKPWVANRNALTALHQMSEDPTAPGTYYGIDCREFDTHASGQVVKLVAPPTSTANQVTVAYVTHRDTQAPTPSPGPNHSGFYRNPVRLADGTLVAAHTSNTEKERNVGTAAAPRSLFDFRLKTLVQGGNGAWQASKPLTKGLSKRVQYYDPFNLITYDGRLWELDAVEVVARPVPPASQEPALPAPEQQALAAEGVLLADLRQYLTASDLALIVSRDVTARDRNDRQQPFNLRVAGTSTQTLGVGSSGPIYDVAYLRLFQGDLVRGITNGVAVGGRRVLAQPLHEAAADNPPAPAGPSGSVALESDGSLAALVPARRAMTWQLADPAGVPVVNERFWISFQPGEIRSCTNCHGVNEEDQARDPAPTNEPLALRTLLQHLKAQGHL